MSTSTHGIIGTPYAIQTSRVTGARSPLRLTRRGRVVLILLPLLLGAAAILVLGGLVNPPAAASTAAPQTGTTVVTVQPGETLWTIAARHEPNRDTRDVVAELVRLNNLDSSTLQAGQRLYVSVRAEA